MYELLDVPVFAVHQLPDGSWEILGRDWDDPRIERLMIIPQPTSDDLWIVEYRTAA